MANNKIYQIEAGQSYPLGANYDDKGVNFALFSACAERVELCLFDPTVSMKLPAWSYRNTLTKCGTATFRICSRARCMAIVCMVYDPENGHRFNPHKLLLDPYARALTGELNWNAAHFGYELGHDDLDLSFDTRDSAPFTPKCRVIDPRVFDGQDPHRPAVPWSETILYETHVKGFTQLHPAVPPELRGTFEGMGHKAIVDYIKSLGITSVELLPVHAFPDDQHLLDRGLKNFWGYNTLNFFSPASRYYGERHPGIPRYGARLPRCGYRSDPGCGL